MPIPASTPPANGIDLPGLDGVVVPWSPRPEGTVLRAGEGAALSERTHPCDLVRARDSDGSPPAAARAAIPARSTAHGGAMLTPKVTEARGGAAHTPPAVITTPASAPRRRP